MAERLRHLAVLFGLMIGLAFSGAIPTHAETMADYEDMRANIEGQHKDLVARATLARSAKELTDGISLLAGFSPPTAEAWPAPADKAVSAAFDLIDLRLVLAQLSAAVGSNDQLLVVRAQSQAASKAIVVLSGSASLSDLRDWIAAHPDADSLMQGDTILVPLVIFQTARLNLSKGDVLALSSSDGAFLANFGTLVISGAEVASTEATNPRAPRFRPFVVTASTGLAHINDAVFTGLGFGETSAFSGLSIINRGLYTQVGQSILMNNLLRDTNAVTVEGAESVQISGNVFVGGRAGGLDLRGTMWATITANLFIGGAKGTSLRIRNDASSTEVTGNIILDSAGTGISISHGGSDTKVVGNLIWGAKGGGISVSRSDCVMLSGNVAIDNGTKGIEVRTSRNSRILANRVMGNNSAGIFIGDQPVGTQTKLEANVFIGNRFGLSTAAAHWLTLHENNFQNQFPRFVEGDLAGQAPLIVQDLRGLQQIDITTGGIELVNLAPLNCLLNKGI